MLQPKFACAGLLALLATPTFASDRPVNGVDVSTHRASGPSQTHALVSDAEVPGGRAMRVDVSGASDKPWLAALDTVVGKPVAVGDKLVATVMLRVPADSAKGKVLVAFQLNEAPYTQFASSTAAVPPSWTAFRLKLTAPRAFDASKLKINLQMGFAKQTIDVGPILIVNTTAKD